MLQQTRVETVIPYYERFLARFPDLRSLATADTDDVLGEWAGLGYYGRARNLQTAARQVVEEWGGEMPDDVEGLRSLKGVGRYTAGAVASIAFDRPAPVVDGNVARVLTRLLEIREDVRSAPVVRRLWEEAETLARGRSPGDLNQALMELGATVCTPRSPLCEVCPIAAHCRARESGDPEAIPVKRPRAKPKRLEAAAAFLERRGKALAVRRPPRGLLGGLWELPGGELRDEENPEEGLARAIHEHVGLDALGDRGARHRAARLLAPGPSSPRLPGTGSLGPRTAGGLRRPSMAAARPPGRSPAERRDGQGPAPGERS